MKIILSLLLVSAALVYQNEGNSTPAPSAGPSADGQNANVRRNDKPKEFDFRTKKETTVVRNSDFPKERRFKRKNRRSSKTGDTVYEVEIEVEREGSGFREGDFDRRRRNQFEVNYDEKGDRREDRDSWKGNKRNRRQWEKWSRKECDDFDKRRRCGCEEEHEETCEKKEEKKPKEKKKKKKAKKAKGKKKSCKCRKCTPKYKGKGGLFDLKHIGQVALGTGGIAPTSGDMTISTKLGAVKLEPIIASAQIPTMVKPPLDMVEQFVGETVMDKLKNVINACTNQTSIWLHMDNNPLYLPKTIREPEKSSDDSSRQDEKPEEEEKEENKVEDPKEEEEGERK